MTNKGFVLFRLFTHVCMLYSSENNIVVYVTSSCLVIRRQLVQYCLSDFWKPIDYHRLKCSDLNCVSKYRKLRAFWNTCQNFSYLLICHCHLFQTVYLIPVSFDIVILQYRQYDNNVAQYLIYNRSWKQIRINTSGIPVCVP